MRSVVYVRDRAARANKSLFGIVDLPHNIKRYFSLSVCFFWCFAAFAQTKLEDELLIKALLMKEVDALNKTQDLEAYMSCFLPSEEIVFGPQNDKLITGATALRSFAKQIIYGYKKNPNLNTWEFFDWKIRISDNSAFATCTQTTTTPSGKHIIVFKSHYLEKFDGQWKILDHRFWHTGEK